MKTEIIAFSEKGYKLGLKLAEKYNCNVACCSKKAAENLKLEFKNHNEWVKENFNSCDSLIFIGALGIAVRAIAGYIKSKLSDPAVIVIDELGKFTIPLLSGHVGGANKIAAEIADYIGSVPVITTATDINHVFSVDSWAVSQNLKIKKSYMIKEVSSKVLNGEKIIIKSDIPVEGKTPQNVEVKDFDYEGFFDVIITADSKENSRALILLRDEQTEKVSF